MIILVHDIALELHKTRANLLHFTQSLARNRFMRSFRDVIDGRAHNGKLFWQEAKKLTLEVYISKRI